ncbi:sugar phosphate isomerase/epimerase family protein [Pediococcus argentinicus]|nr:TIM barrel protein [Pediococcus argentinicus]NKZ22563.1 TIM barrel protein [Pediococcus argentinicus]GEP19599.1 hypothetical protein LSA03_09830 [Pediococcus argentinicus]
MSTRKISANLLLLVNEWNNGKTQAEMISELDSMDFSAVEIRREYFRDLVQEIPEISSVVQSRNLDLYYSVPDEVFVDGKLNPKLEEYLKEAQQMNVSKIKWNIGDFEHFSGNLKETLEPLMKYGIEINIENDQTQTSGRIEPIKKFMKAVQDSNSDIGYVYDLGNWPFTGDDAMEASKELGQFARYIHVKDVEITDGKPDVKPLDGGQIDWRSILDVLPSDVPIALEYPADSLQVIKNGIDKLEEAVDK